MGDAHRNHYVPRWYQARFLVPGKTTYLYLDKAPELVTRGDLTHKRRDILPWGPKKCFYQDDLYTTRFGSLSNDEIERFFFGPIDERGRSAVSFFAEFGPTSAESRLAHEAFQNLMSFMAAQRYRTPRGLNGLRSLLGLRNHTATLLAMQAAFQADITMWTEGVWEIVRCSKSPAKFLVSDNPVTFYNARAFPTSAALAYPNDANLGALGTRTLFPLGPEACLIITHVQLTRKPWADHGRFRTNARAFAQTMMNLLDIQFGRELEENEVHRINFILKHRAARYVASAEREWLFPEVYLQTTHWSKLDADWFLFPNLYKIKFTSGIVAGYSSGRSFAMDEYGHRPGQQGYQDERRRDREFASHQVAQIEWAIKRRGKSIAHVHKMQHDEVEDVIMAEDLAREACKTKKRRRPD